MKTQTKKIRLPRKLKKKYGKTWKIYLSMYILKKSTGNFVNILTSACNAALAISKLFAAVPQSANKIYSSGKRPGKSFVFKQMQNWNLLIKKS